MNSLTHLATAPPFRILVFPGYLQNANVMSVKLEQLRQSLAHCCEFVVVDPPFVVHPPTPLGGEPPAEEYSWGEASDAARVWWFLSAADREKSWVVPRLDETMWYLRDIMETKGPFDAIFAFSQGAACASLLVANLDDPSRHPAFAKPAENWPPAQFKFAVLISGFLPIDPRIDWFNKKPIDLPTLHVLAAGDSVVSTDNSLILSRAFVNSRVELHTGGHFVPSKPAWQSFIAQFIEASILGEDTTTIGAPIESRRPSLVSSASVSSLSSFTAIEPKKKSLRTKSSIASIGEGEVLGSTTRRPQTAPRPSSPRLVRGPLARRHSSAYILTPIEKPKEPTSPTHSISTSSTSSSITVPSPITTASPKPELVDAATDTHDLYCPVQLLTPPTPTTKASRPRPMSAFGPFRVTSIDPHLPEEQPSAAPLSKKISSGKLRTLVAFFNRGSEHQRKEKLQKTQD